MVYRNTVLKEIYSWTVLSQKVKALFPFETFRNNHPRTQRHFTEHLNLQTITGRFARIIDKAKLDKKAQKRCHTLLVHCTDRPVIVRRRGVRKVTLRQGNFKL